MSVVSMVDASVLYYSHILSLSNTLSNTNTAQMLFDSVLQAAANRGVVRNIQYAKQ